MKHSYLLHSTGDWDRSKTKYISKDKDNKHYKYSDEQMAIYESHRDEKESEEEEELSEEEKARLEGEKKFEEKAKTAGTSTSDSSKKKSGSSSKSKQPKSVADMIKTSGKGAAAASKEKAGKAAKEKSGSSKAAKEKTTKEPKEKKVKEEVEKFDHYTTSSTKVQKALKTYADLGKGDSITSKLDADGNWESTVTYENGDTQTFVMDKKYKILKTGDRKTSVQHAMELANDFLIQNGFDEDEEFLAHHGVLGQRWGIRRYQNPDGTLTSAGKKRLKGLYDFEKDEVTKEGYRKGSAIYRADRHSEDWYSFNKINPMQDDPTAEFYELLQRELSDLRKNMSDGERFVNDFIYEHSQTVRNNYPGKYESVEKIYDKQNLDHFNSQQQLEKEIYEKQPNLRLFGESPIDWTDKQKAEAKGTAKELLDRYYEKESDWYKRAEDLRAEMKKK